MVDGPSLWEPKRELTVVVEGHDLPGRRFPRPDGGWYEDVQVGVQRAKEVVDLVPGDAASATWRFPVAFTPGPPAAFRGPFVHGRGEERFLYLSWGTVWSGPVPHVEMFRRAKLRLDGIPGEVLAALADADPATALRARLPLARNGPICASVWPPVIEWSLDP